MAWTSHFAAVARDERVILVAIGLGAFSIVSGMISVLAMVRDDARIEPPEPKTRYITQDTEDALQLGTVDKLLGHPNHSIRDIAVKILCDRAINDPETTEYLLYGITRPDYDERIQSLRALALLTGQTSGQDGLSKLNSARAYSAIVRSLELSLDDTARPRLDDPYWDEYLLRDMAERFCLMFVLELSRPYGASPIVRAGFVERWLAKQEWGDDPEKRMCNFKNYLTKNNRIVDIVNQINRSRRGLRALVKAGLVPKDASRRRVRELPELLASYSAGVTLPPLSPLEDRSVPRSREQSAEEQRLRRQHREAIVMNDGTRPLAWEDIIERDPGSPGRDLGEPVVVHEGLTRRPSWENAREGTEGVDAQDGVSPEFI